MVPSRGPFPHDSRFSLQDAEPLSALERLALWALVGSAVVVTTASLVVSGTEEVGAAIFAVIVAALFAGFAWSPAVTATLLGVAMIVSFFVGNSSIALFAVALGAGCVLRTASSRLILAYGGALLLATAAVAHFTGGAPVDVAGYLLLTATAGAVGLVLRAAVVRGRRLGEELERRNRQEIEAVARERRRIADELHDNIAHDLTVIDMHARVLENETDVNVRRESEALIGDVARKALVDLHRVVALAGDSLLNGAHATDLHGAFSEAVRTLAPTGRRIELEGDPRRCPIAPQAEEALATIVRESVTNILKHGGDGDVRIALDVDPATVSLSVRNALPRTPRCELPTGGRGVTRMGQRSRGLGGSFHAGARGDVWVVSVRIPRTDGE